MRDVTKMEGYEEMVRKFASGLTPEQHLAGLAPEQRLAGLAPEQKLLAMPDDALRALSEDYLRSLPMDVQDAIRKRIGRPSK
ncbi:MAG: hypothetical protein L6Q76_02565 [Polyangiaceae bacterium]|nr:hypothetical protein [Polyangiaceae bacterium]